MGKDQSQAHSKKITLTIDNGDLLSSYFMSVCDDIFRKFDMLMGKELSYEEFAVFY